MSGSGASKGLSKPTIFGLALICFFISAAFAFAAIQSKLPAKEDLSVHQIKPTGFGLLQTSRLRVSQSVPNVVGYAFTVPADSIPYKYDRSTDPSVSEPAIMSLKVRYLILHDALGFNDRSEPEFHSLVGRPIEVWFFQGKIVGIEANGHTVVPLNLVQSGLAVARLRWGIAASVAFLLGIGLVYWMPFLRLFRSLLVRVNFFNVKGNL